MYQVIGSMGYDALYKPTAASPWAFSKPPYKKVASSAINQAPSATVPSSTTVPSATAKAGGVKKQGAKSQGGKNQGEKSQGAKKQGEKPQAAKNHGEKPHAATVPARRSSRLVLHHMINRNKELGTTNSTPEDAVCLDD